MPRILGWQKWESQASNAVKDLENWRLLVTRKNTEGELRKWLSGEGACWTIVGTWVQIPGACVKSDVVAHICDLTALWHMERENFPELLSQLDWVCTVDNSGDLVSNKMEGEDWFPKLSSDSCTHAVLTHKDRNECKIGITALGNEHLLNIKHGPSILMPSYLNLRQRKTFVPTKTCAWIVIASVLMLHKTSINCQKDRCGKVHSCNSVESWSRMCEPWKCGQWNKTDTNIHTLRECICRNP